MAMNVKLVVAAGIGMLGAAAAVFALLWAGRPKEHRGHLSLGFETSAFTPCGAPEGERWWVAGLPPEGHQRYRELTSKMYEPVFVRVRGALSSPGNYGHLGAYQRELTVLELLELRKAKEPGEDCKP